MGEGEAHSRHQVLGHVARHALILLAGHGKPACLLRLTEPALEL